MEASARHREGTARDQRHIEFFVDELLEGGLNEALDYWHEPLVAYVLEPEVFQNVEVPDVFGIAGFVTGD